MMCAYHKRKFRRFDMKTADTVYIPQNLLHCNVPVAHPQVYKVSAAQLLGLHSLGKRWWLVGVGDQLSK